MKPQSEKHVEKELVKLVQLRGGQAVKMSLIGNVGFPDRLIVLPDNKIGFIECKTTGEKLRPRQKYWQRVLRKLGVHCYELDHTQHIRLYLDMICLD